MLGCLFSFRVTVLGRRSGHGLMKPKNLFKPRRVLLMRQKLLPNLLELKKPFAGLGVFSEPSIARRAGRVITLRQKLLG